MGLFLLDYGAGNVQSLANSLTKLGYTFNWISSPEDLDKATSLIFPGVGAFESAIAGLSAKGLLEPLRSYIRSGKPYFGICIGMQVLFESSSEARSLGLGIIPSPILRFTDSNKSVPHIGWNTSDLPGQDDSKYFYFVHSYCAKYDPVAFPEGAKWVHATTQYGDELFVSQVKRGNVYGVQFHPEKSGEEGLKLLDDWLRTPELERASQHDDFVHPSIRLKPVHNLTKRIVACMDVRANDDGDLVVTKGDQYDVRERAVSAQVSTAGAIRNLGKPVALAAQYFQAGADELCLLNITSFRHSPLNDQPMLAVVRAAAETIFVPLTIGGGIKATVDPDGTKHSALEVAGAYFRAGADKVSIGSEAVYAVERLMSMNPSLDLRATAQIDNSLRGDGTSAIETIAHAYGAQAVVVSIDPRRVYVDPATYDGPYASEIVLGSQSSIAAERDKAWWYQCTVSGGRENRNLSVCQLALGVQLLGAGEILVNSIDRDGTGLGFDLQLIKMVKATVKIPVVASSGAGSSQHFVDVFEETDVEAALAAGIFHRGEVGISEVKDRLKQAGINVRQ